MCILTRWECIFSRDKSSVEYYSVGVGLCILSQDSVSVSVGVCTWECVFIWSCFVRLFLTLCVHTVNTKKMY